MIDLSWLPRENDLKDHSLFDDRFFGDQAPSVKYEKRPIVDDKGKPVAGLYSAWIVLNNPAQYNSYTTGMAKAIVAGFQKASSDRSVVAAVFTAVLPVSAVLLSYTILGEPFRWAHVAGGACVIAGIGLLARERV